MITVLIVVGSVLGYLAVASWVWGYCCARWAGNWCLKHGYDGREPSYYYDEPEAYVTAAVWPLYVVFALILGKTIKTLAHAGENKGHKHYRTKKIRIELEKKIRVEQERVEQEAQEEIEEALRQESAA